MKVRFSETVAERQPIHERDIQWRAYRRKDGLWDLEASLSDIRCYDSVLVEKGPLPAGNPVHLLGIRVTVDDSLTVSEVEAAMEVAPYHPCPDAPKTLTRLIGANLGKGWRQRVEHDVGGEQGCAHLRDLLNQAPTVAFQTIAVWNAQQSGDVLQPKGEDPPPHLGSCLSWAFGGPVVSRIYPMFKDYSKR